MKTFEIKVTQVETDVPTTEQKYEIIGTDKSGDHKYGYVNHDTTETVETVIYTQKMNELSVADLAVFLNRDQDRPFSSPTVAIRGVFKATDTILRAGRVESEADA